MNIPDSFRMIAKTLYGLEEVLAAELSHIGAGDIEQLNRAVEFTGDKQVMYRANLETRTALRILQPVHEFTATSEQELYDGVQEIDWSGYLGTGKTLAVDSVVNSDTFTHSHYVILKVKDAIVDQFRSETGERPSVDTEDPDLRIHIYIDDTNCSLALDSSGDSLHRRGYRTEKTMAPVNEVLAAGMVLLSGWDRQGHFIDPMCGSGTILIEAALYAHNLAPGLLRKNFGFQEWRDYDAGLFHNLTSEAWNRFMTTDAQLIGADKSGKAIRITGENAQRAQVGESIRLERQGIEEFVPPSGPGTVIMNPPYGERMEQEDITDFHGMIGDQLKTKYPGYTAWILSANKEAIKRVGLRTSERLTLYNGPLECKFHRFDMYRGSK